MKMLKKLAALTLSATLFTATVLGFGTQQASAQGESPGNALDAQTMFYFPVDVEGHWAADRLHDFVYSDIIKGYVTADAEGLDQVEVRPNNPISRAEFVAILVRALHLTSTAPAKTFRDVKAGQWYYEPIRIASSLGIVSGLSETEFAPTRPIRRDEIATLVVRAFDKTVNFTEGQAKAFTDVPNYWATPFINNASRAGIINGYTGGLFKPAANATRAEAVTMLYNSLRKEVGTLPADDDLTQIVLGSTNESAAAISSGDYTLLDNVANKYHTAKDKVIIQQTDEVLQEITTANNLTLKMTPQNLTTQVTQKSDRFATVTLSGSMEVVVNSPDTSVTRKQNAASIYYLRKLPGENTWRIYHSVSTAEEGSMFPF